MTEAYALESSDEPDDNGQGLISVPTGKEVRKQDSLAGMKSLLNQVAMVDYRGYAQTGEPPRTVYVAHAVIRRGSPEDPEAKSYCIVPRLEFVPEV